MHVVNLDYSSHSNQGPVVQSVDRATYPVDKYSQNLLSYPMHSTYNLPFEQLGPGGQSDTLMLLWFKMNAT